MMAPMTIFSINFFHISLIKFDPKSKISNVKFEALCLESYVSKAPLFIANRLSTVSTFHVFSPLAYAQVIDDFVAKGKPASAKFLIQLGCTLDLRLVKSNKSEIVRSMETRLEWLGTRLDGRGLDCLAFYRLGDFFNESEPYHEQDSSKAQTKKASAKARNTTKSQETRIVPDRTRAKLHSPERFVSLINEYSETFVYHNPKLMESLLKFKIVKTLSDLEIPKKCIGFVIEYCEFTYDFITSLELERNETMGELLSELE